jgi:hypothetical protein
MVCPSFVGAVAIPKTIGSSADNVTPDLPLVDNFGSFGALVDNPA